MSVNKELIEEVCRTAEAAGNLHNQGEWLEGGGYFPEDRIFPPTPVLVSQMRDNMCGTTACLAGYTVLLAAPGGSSTDGSYVYGPDSDSVSIEEYAQEKLGITDLQRWAVFYCGDNKTAIARLRYVAKHPGITGSILRIMFPPPDIDYN